MTRLRVLIGAHELSPAQGSECAVGWNIVTRLAEFHDVTVLYASGSQFHKTSYVEAVQQHLEKHGPIAGLTLINIDQRPMTKFFTALNRPFMRLGPTGLPVLYYMGYKFWQRAAYKKAKELHGKENFDVVHQLTQISFREPGYLWKLGIPFFWGPTGGTEMMPPEFYSILSKKYRLLEWVRKFSNWYQFRFILRVVKANQKASIIYAFSNGDARRLKKRAKGNVKLMLDVGAQKCAEDEQVPKEISLLNGVWCGRLTELKAPEILLDALSSSGITKEKIGITVIGTGPLEEQLRKKAESMGLKNINWVGNVDHSNVFKYMSEADFLVHTSLREATSSVIPEALSMGLPVICHDAYGMSVAVTEGCGIKVPFTSPDSSVHGFHDALEKLVTNPDYLKGLKAGAKKRAGEISWENMVKTISSDYLSQVNVTTAKIIPILT